MKTNLLILSMYSTKIYVKKIVEEIIKKSKKSINKFGPTFRNITCLEATAQLSKIKPLNIFDNEVQK